MTNIFDENLKDKVNVKRWFKDVETRFNAILHLRSRLSMFRHGVQIELSSDSIMAEKIIVRSELASQEIYIDNDERIELIASTLLKQQFIHNFKKLYPEAYKSLFVKRCACPCHTLHTNIDYSHPIMKKHACCNEGKKMRKESMARYKYGWRRSCSNTDSVIDASVIEVK